MKTRTAKETGSKTRTKEATSMKKTAKSIADVTAIHPKEKVTMKKKNATNTPASATHTKEVTTMKKNAGTTATESDTTGATTTGDVPSQLQALEERCGYGDPLPDDVRDASERLVRRVPSTIVDRVLALAGRGGGSVAGIALDPVAAKAALAAADDADAVANAALMLARRAQDQSIRLRSGVMGEVVGIKTALRGYVKTKQGASLAQASDEIASLAKQHVAARKARRTRIVNEITASSAGKEETTGEPVVTPVAAEAPAAPKAS